MSEKNKTKNESPDNILNGTEYEWLNDVHIPYNVIPKEHISPKIKKLQENFETIPKNNDFKNQDIKNDLKMLNNMKKEQNSQKEALSQMEQRYSHNRKDYTIQEPNEHNKIRDDILKQSKAKPAVNSKIEELQAQISNNKPVDLVKPLVPQKSQKDLDTDKKIIKEHNQKTNEPKTYTSQLTVNLKPIEKSKVAPKSIIKANNQTEKPYGKNVANKKLLFESPSNTQESKANSKVGKLKDNELRRSFMEKLSKTIDQNSDTSRSRG